MKNKEPERDENRMDNDQKKLERLRARYKRQNEAMKGKYDRISVTFPIGTKERIKALGFTAHGLIHDLVLAELDRLEDNADA